MAPELGGCRLDRGYVRKGALRIQVKYTQSRAVCYDWRRRVGLCADLWRRFVRDMKAGKHFGDRDSVERTEMLHEREFLENNRVIMGNVNTNSSLLAYKVAARAIQIYCGSGQGIFSATVTQ